MRLLFSLFTILGLGFPAAAEKHEIGLTLGRISGPTRASSAGEVSLDPGIALQANYGYRFLMRRSFALSAEVHFLANGQREIRSPNLAATRDIATLYVTPGLRVKFAPRSRIAPYVAAGGGYALYEQSLFRLDEAPNPAPRFTHRKAFMFGGGVDVPVWRWLGVRLEARDFYTGNPSFNAPIRSNGQHNVVVGGGFVLSFGGRE
jgi:Outer membrane protein beta-barrel domain